MKTDMGNMKPRKKLLFLTLVIAGVIFCVALKAHAQLVVIDPAHGGDDLGVSIGGVAEKNIALGIARHLQRELQSAKIAARMTRSEDQYLSLKMRWDIAKTSRASLLISIHINAGFDQKAAGFEIFNAEFFGEQNVKGEDEQKAILGDMRRTTLLNDNVRIAASVDEALIKHFPGKSRGVNRAPLSIVEGLNIPALVVEIGFATNPAELKEMQTEAFQKKAALAIAQGMIKALR